MSRSFASALLLAVVAACAPNGDRTLHGSRSALSFTVPDPEGSGTQVPQCEATPVGAYVLSTARHCVMDSAGEASWGRWTTNESGEMVWEPGRVRLPDGSEAEVSAVRYAGTGAPYGSEDGAIRSRQDDVAYLVVDRPVTDGGATVVPVGAPAMVGERLVVLDQFGNEREVTVTSVSGNDVRTASTTDTGEAATIPGDSGGLLARVIYDENGNRVGVEQVGVVSGPNPDDTTSFTTVDRAAAESLATRAENGEIAERSFLGETEDRRQAAADARAAAERDLATSRADLERTEGDLATATDPEQIAALEAERDRLQTAIAERETDRQTHDAEVTRLGEERTRELEGLREDLVRERDELRMQASDLTAERDELMRQRDEADRAAQLGDSSASDRVAELDAEIERTNGAIAEAEAGAEQRDARLGSWPPPSEWGRRADGGASDRADQLGCETDATCAAPESVPSESCVESGSGCEDPPAPDDPPPDHPPTGDPPTDDPPPDDPPPDDPPTDDPPTDDPPTDDPPPDDPPPDDPPPDDPPPDDPPPDPPPDDPPPDPPPDDPPPDDPPPDDPPAD